MPTHVATTKTLDTDSGTTSAPTFTVANAAALLIVGIVPYRGGSTPSVTSALLDGATAFSRDQHQAITIEDAHAVEIWSLGNISAGIHTINITYPASVNKVVIFITEVSGVATASWQDGAGAAASGPSAPPASGIGTAVRPDSFWYALAVTDSLSAGATVTAGSGWIIPTNGSETDGSANNVCGCEYIENLGALTKNGNWTTMTQTAEWAAAVQAYRSSANLPTVRSGPVGRKSRAGHSVSSPGGYF